MKKYVSFLPIFLLFIAFGCSEPAPVKETKPVETEKSLLEREPEVREYLEVVDEAVDKYLTVAEDFIDNYDKFEGGEMTTLEQLSMVAEMSDSYFEIMELNEELIKIEDKKSEVEGVLDGDDLTDFGVMVADKMVRYNELVARIDSTDFSATTSMIEDWF